jgi:hypothetical protein
VLVDHPPAERGVVGRRRVWQGPEIRGAREALLVEHARVFNAALPRGQHVLEGDSQRSMPGEPQPLPASLSGQGLVGVQA